jgi:Flp pilus assembly pilin Flp
LEGAREMKSLTLRLWCNCQSRFAQVRAREHGATAIEYAIMASLIAAVVIIVVTAVGQKTSSSFESINQADW